MATFAVQRVLRSASCVACTLLALVATADAQSSTRRATNLAALTAYPSFYHMQPVVVLGTLAQLPSGEYRVSDGAASLRVIPDGNAPEGSDEVRGQFLDLGRMKADDPRLAGYDLRKVFHVDPDGAWPRPGEVTVIIASAITPAAALPVPPLAPIRAIVLDASRYIDQTVTVSGQYQGRNLMGDLPDAPGRSRYDFVLRSADAAIWITNLRPKGKDARGRDFDLGLDARIDTGRWLQVSGTVKQGRGLLWIDGQAASLVMVQTPAGVADEAREAPIRIPAAPAPEVVFSTPTADETDVAMGSSVRIQFSRDIDPRTIKGHIQVRYLGAGGDQSAASTVEFRADYAAATRVIELKFAKPLERLRTVSVELLDGLLGTDQQPVKLWTLMFATGG